MSRKALMQKLKTAKAGGTGNYWRDGRYRFVVKKMSLEKTPLEKDIFKVIFTVMHSTKIVVVSPQTGKTLDIEPNPVGSDVDWIQGDLFGAKSPSGGNIRKLMLELFNKREIDDNEYIDTFAEMCDVDGEGNNLPVPQELAKGMVIDMETNRIITKTNQKEIVVPRWTHVPQTEAERQQMIGWLGQVTAYQAQVAAQGQATA